MGRTCSGPGAKAPGSQSQVYLPLANNDYMALDKSLLRLLLAPRVAPSVDGSEALKGEVQLSKGRYISLRK